MGGGREGGKEGEGGGEGGSEEEKEGGREGRRKDGRGLTRNVAFARVSCQASSSLQAFESLFSPAVSSRSSVSFRSAIRRISFAESYSLCARSNLAAALCASSCSCGRRRRGRWRRNKRRRRGERRGR